MEKECSLLRPFDLEAAKRGEPVAWVHDGSLSKQVVVLDSGKVVIEWADGPVQFYTIEEGDARFLRMAPLCWVEEKPVYNGDGPLYHHKLDSAEYYEFIAEDFSDGKLGLKSVPAGYMVASPENLTWTPPKVKREVNLLAYLTGENLVWKRCDVEVPDFYIRVPSEDKVIVVEE